MSHGLTSYTYIRRKLYVLWLKEGGSVNEHIKKAMEKFFRCVSGIITVSKGGWIVDSGATCHMCNDESQFIQLKRLRTIQEVRLGNGRPLDGTAEGTIRLETLLPDGKTKNFTVENVLFVPKLSYNLLSVSNAGRDRGKQA